MTLQLNAAAAPSDYGTLDTPLLVVVLGTGPSLTDELRPIDGITGGALGRALSRRDFRGGRDETLHLSGGERGAQRVLLVGMGGGAATDRVTALRRAGAIAGRQGNRLGVGRLTFFAGSMTVAEAEAAGVGLIAGAWDFKELKSAVPEDEQRALLELATILATGDGGNDAVTRGVRAAQAIGEGHSLARRLGMLPGNICTPDYLADTAREIAQRFGMQLTVLGRADMEREKMGSFLCVAQGTSQEPKLIALEYRRGPKDGKPIALVGKGLCFDSGGISIKPAQGMEWMKFDMCGAAGVLGAMEAIGRLELPVNVVGLIGSTTNMPSGEAVKPGDVVQASNGKFIEIINTDAEGRLVLADVLAYAKRFSPEAVVDAATLTGACVIALGHTATGVMGNDDALVQEVLDAAKRAGEPGWPLPLWDDYKDLIKSDVADIKNSGGRPAGTITAALFLKEFAEGYPWVHLDIAGTAYTESDLGTVPRGPTGVPVGTFVELVRGRIR
ncbi:MAG TPA: leucyl aminopeptidase [Gemmatimonadaceae bacterium]|jgi:leucyl aminopeptidase|nr:leucyl aminopeptidase [Gemmatimonadaceae bacterium]